VRKIAAAGTAVVVAHLGVSLLHRQAHIHLQIMLTRNQWLFVLAVITLAPPVAAILLWTRLRRVAAWLLLLSMLGSFVFGAYYHFVAVSPDNVSQVPPGAWGTRFQLSAVLLAVVEGLGCGVGIWALRQRLDLIS
jgi:hypothetical protein